MLTWHRSCAFTSEPGALDKDLDGAGGSSYGGCRRWLTARTISTKVARVARQAVRAATRRRAERRDATRAPGAPVARAAAALEIGRSEERRVGKEWRSGRAGRE